MQKRKYKHEDTEGKEKQSTTLTKKFFFSINQTINILLTILTLRL